MYYKKETGKNGEDIVAEYLKELGYIVLDRNFSCKEGEIDIIAKDKDEFVFIEVKTRSNKKYGFPSEAVNKQKIKHLLRAIKYYIYLNGLADKYIRIDVVEVYIINKKFYINHIKKAID